MIATAVGRGVVPKLPLSFTLSAVFSINKQTNILRFGSHTGLLGLNDQTPPPPSHPAYWGFQKAPYTGR
jgi:hypothetical protein